MKRLAEFVWPTIGIAAMAISFWFLYQQLNGLSVIDIGRSLGAIPRSRLILAFASSLIAYVALAFYDAVALQYLERPLPWRFISLVSFTTYALSHNIGATVIAGGVVRYRAYTTKGLSLPDVTFLVLFCSFTFILGTLLLGAMVLIVEPAIVDRFLPMPVWMARASGFGMLAIVALYLLGSLLNLKPFRWRNITFKYPSTGVTLRQIAIAPVELIAAAGIVYFALPAAGNPGFLIVLGIFIASFSAGLLSHAPGGLGVLEALCVTAIPSVPKADVLAALLVFRLFYLILPLIFSLFVVFRFEQQRLAQALRPK